VPRALLSTLAAVLCLSAALLLATPATAQAGWRIDRARAIAEVVWHHPCVDAMTLHWGATPRDEAGDPAAGVAMKDDCDVTLDAIDSAPWEIFCTTVLHEQATLLAWATRPEALCASGTATALPAVSVGTAPTSAAPSGAGPTWRSTGVLVPALNSH
jgi:hypothetical protein